MNAGLAVDLDILGETGAEGIGLFRTEFQFMVAEEMPRLDGPDRALRARAGRGRRHAGDLPHPGPRRRQAAALHGGRSARTTRPWAGAPSAWAWTGRPCCACSMRALIAAAKGRELRIMFPLVATVDEFRAARAFVDQEVAWAQRRGRPAPARLDVGAMIEAPVAAVAPGRAAADDRLRLGRHQRPDAVSVRRRPRQPPGRRPLRPAVAGRPARAEDRSSSACADTGTPVSVCGEMAGPAAGGFRLAGAWVSTGCRCRPPASGRSSRWCCPATARRARRGLRALLKASAGSVRNEIETLARKLTRRSDTRPNP